MAANGDNCFSLPYYIVTSATCGLRVELEVELENQKCLSKTRNWPEMQRKCTVMGNGEPNVILGGQN